MNDASLRVGLAYDDTIDRVGGIALYVTTLGGALEARGHHVEYLIGSSSRHRVGRAPVHSLARNIQVRFNGNALSMPAWSAGRQLKRVLQDGRFDVLHVQVPYSPVMAGRLLVRADPRCAVIGTYHVASERRAPQVGAWLLRALTLRSARHFDETISVSRVAAEFAARWSGMKAERVVPNLLDLRHVRSVLEDAGPGIQADIVFVGRLVPRKGVEQLLCALGRVRERGGPTPTVAILGDGPLRARLERRSVDLALGDSVTFYGEVPDCCKLVALSRARVACFPSLFGESFGVVILEALAAGADVVLAGANPGYAELLVDRRALVDPHDTDAFANQLELLLSDDGLRAKLACGQRALLDRSDSEQVCDEVLRVYRGALLRRRGPATARRTAIQELASVAT
jgi:phosphatidylinositol alpha-mannosyltransferase